MSLLIRLINHINKQFWRWVRARNLNINFIRTKSFQIPSKLKVDNTERKLYLPNNTTYVELFRDIILDDEYHLISLKKKNIVNIVDIGANLGIFSVAARVSFPNSVIHSYEPNPDNLPLLNKNSSQFSFICFEEAVSNISGKGSLSSTSPNDTSATISKNNEGLITLSNLKTVISRFSNKKIDLLKLDCEGSEFDILRDCNELHNVRYIAMEYHLPIDDPETKLAELLTTLSENKFSVIHQDRRNICLGIIVAKNDR